MASLLFLIFSNICFSLLIYENNTIYLQIYGEPIIERKIYIYNNENKTYTNIFLPLKINKESIINVSVPFYLILDSGILFEGLQIFPNQTKVIILKYKLGKNEIIRYSYYGLLKTQENVIIYDCPIYSEWSIYNIVLPYGAYIKSYKKILFASPAGYKLFSNGQNIILSFNLSTCQPIYITYEIYTPPVFLLLFIFIILLEIILIYLLILTLVKRYKFKSYLQLLKPEEKHILYLIFKNKNKLPQKDLYGVEEFSRAKVSRILKELEERNIIERKTVGKEKIIYIKLLR